MWEPGIPSALSRGKFQLLNVSGNSNYEIPVIKKPRMDLHPIGISDQSINQDNGFPSST